MIAFEHVLAYNPPNEEAIGDVVPAGYASCLALRLFLMSRQRWRAIACRLTPEHLDPREVNTSDNLGEILIGGLYRVEAPPGATKRVLLRAIGPSLAEQGVPGALADTVIAVYQEGTSIASNNNWRDTQETEIEATTIPPTNDLESAVVLDLGAGEYTALVYGTQARLSRPVIGGARVLRWLKFTIWIRHRWRGW